MTVGSRLRVALPAALALLLLPPLAGGPRCEGTRAFRFATRTMGTTATLTLVGTDSLALAPLAARALACFARVDSLMSNWTRSSEVARLNGGLDGTVDGAPLAVEPETARVIAAALAVAAESDGAFDPTVEPLVRLWGFLGGEKRVPAAGEIAALLPSVGAEQLRWDAEASQLAARRSGLRLDLGGIAKGYAVDCVRDTLLALGLRDALIDLSGNIALFGAPPGREAWRLGIRDPVDREATLGRLSLPRAAVATSGDYEQFFAADGKRYGHILDPRRGWPVDSLASVTVVMDSATLADAWATALTVLGPTAARRLARARLDMDVILIERRPAAQGPDLVWVEESLAANFSLAPTLSTRYSLRRF
jgi:thiamine biosynthesis lipoprotein